MAVLFLVLSGCADDTDLIHEVQAASVTVDTARCPARVRAEIHASKPTPCHKVLPARIRREDQDVFVHIEIEDTGAICIQIIEEFTIEVDLGTFAPGTYELVVETFTDEHRSPFVVDATCTR